jgi:hypothetical protein
MTGAVGRWCNLTRIAEHLLNVDDADTSEARGRRRRTLFPVVRFIDFALAIQTFGAAIDR